MVRILKMFVEWPIDIFVLTTMVFYWIRIAKILRILALCHWQNLSWEAWVLTTNPAVSNSSELLDTFWLWSISFFVCFCFLFLILECWGDHVAYRAQEKQASGSGTLGNVHLFLPSILPVNALTVHSSGRRLRVKSNCVPHPKTYVEVLPSRVLPFLEIESS